MAVVKSEEILDVVSNIDGIYDSEIMELIALAIVESKNKQQAENYDFDEEHFRKTGETRGLTNPKRVDRSYGLWQINFLPAYGDDRARYINSQVEGNPLKFEKLHDIDLVTRESLLEFFHPKHGKEELFKRNVIALRSMWNPGSGFGPWATHPDYAEPISEQTRKNYKAALETAKDVFGFTEWNPSPEYLQLEEQLLQSKSDEEKNRIRSQMKDEYERIKADPRSNRPLINRETTPKLYDQDREVYLDIHGTGKGIPIDLARGSSDMATDSQEIQASEYEDKVMAGIWGWISNNDSLTIDGVHITDIINDPDQYGSLEPGTPQYDEWVFNLLAQTEYYQNSWEGRAQRDADWYKEGQHETFSERRKSLIETELDLIQGLIKEAQLDWTDDQIMQAAKFAWLGGWDENDIREFLISGEMGDQMFGGPLLDFGGRATPGTLQNIGRQEIKETYNDYFVDPTEKDLANWAQQIFLSDDGGATELEQLQDMLREQAADLYPGHAERILAGRTPLSILNSYDTVFTSVMGYKPQWQGEHMEMGVDVLSRKDTATGFAKYLRGTQEYDRTPNAINKGFSVITDLNRLMTGVG